MIDVATNFICFIVFIVSFLFYVEFAVLQVLNYCKERNVFSMIVIIEILWLAL
jgi:hypothetical protein